MDEKNLKIYRIKPRLFNRWIAELYLQKESQKNSGMKILCFGNLPPAFKLSGEVTVFLQNALLLHGLKVPKDSMKLFFRIIYEKIWFNCFSYNADKILVQTNWMKEMLPQYLSSKTELHAIHLTIPEEVKSTQKVEDFDFLAVTGSVRYKNQELLLCSIRLLPSHKVWKIAVVTDSAPQIHFPSHVQVTYFLNIPWSEVLPLYRRSEYLINLSEAESFCLPLYEGKELGIKIISIDRKYVHEACAPDIVIRELTANDLLAAMTKAKEKYAP